MCVQTNYLLYKALKSLLAFIIFNCENSDFLAHQTVRKSYTFFVFFPDLFSDMGYTDFR